MDENKLNNQGFVAGQPNQALRYTHAQNERKYAPDKHISYARVKAEPDSLNDSQTGSQYYERHFDSASLRRDDSEHAFVVRIKWRHLKMAALLLLAFILGSLMTAVKLHSNANYPTSYGIHEKNKTKANVFTVPNAEIYFVK